MEIDITTPAMLFPAISLLLLAYTNRFLTLGTLMRSLTNDNMPTEEITLQVANFRRRIILIKHMQAAGVLSFFCCVISMFLIYLERGHAGSWLFGISLLALAYSLVLSVIEIWISAHALDIHLEYVGAKQKLDESSTDARNDH